MRRCHRQATIQMSHTRGVAGAVPPSDDAGDERRGPVKGRHTLPFERT